VYLLIGMVMDCLMHTVSMHVPCYFSV